MISYSIKQLLRQPGKALLFFLLITASTALVVTGSIMTIENTAHINVVESTYTTVGTINQLPSTTDVKIVSNQCYGTSAETTPEYEEIISADTLMYPGAEYELEPEFRPYYISYLPQIRHTDESWYYCRHIVEFTPAESDIENGEFGEIEITKVIYSDVDSASASNNADHNLQEGEIISFCQCSLEAPLPLKFGERYVCTICQFDCPEHAKEYQPYIAPHSDQLDAEGTLIESPYFEVNGREKAIIRVVGDDFYEEGHPGGAFVQWAKQYERENNNFIITATNSLELLPSWHDKTVQTVSGREIDREEFESGSAVCMVPQRLAEINHLKIGDTINLALLCTYYGSLGGRYGRLPIDLSFLVASGALYEPFWEHEYEIVGLFDDSASENTHDIASDMLIIPAKSVKGDDEKNVVWRDPMSSDTASFQIPNGTIEKFDKGLKEAVPGIECLQITYDDRGYSEIMDSLKLSRKMALLLFIVGMLAALAIVVLLLYFFVVKDKKRTAIERSLGMTKYQCCKSLLTGIMVLTLFAVSLGSLCGVLTLDVVQEQSANLSGTAEESYDQYTYDTRYSLWATDRNLAKETQIVVETPKVLYFAVPLGLFLFELILAIILMFRSFKIDPIYLLSFKGKD